MRRPPRPQRPSRASLNSVGLLCASPARPAGARTLLEAEAVIDVPNTWRTPRIFSTVVRGAT